MTERFHVITGLAVLLTAILHLVTLIKRIEKSLVLLNHFFFDA